MSRHIAVLLANTDTSAFARRYPDDAQKVVAMLQPLRPQWTTRIYAARDGEFPAADVPLDGVIITGSPASVNDPLPWIATAEAFVRDLARRGIPTVGLCFGHQLIARALGGRVVRATDWGLGIGHIDVAATRPWMEPAAPHLNLYAAHQDQVQQLPPGAQWLGGDAFCPNGLFVVGAAPGVETLLGVQYHPELPTDFMRALLDHLEPHLPLGVVARARPQLDTPVDAALFFQWIARFIELPRKTLP